MNSSTFLTEPRFLTLSSFKEILASAVYGRNAYPANEIVVVGLRGGAVIGTSAIPWHPGQAPPLRELDDIIATFDSAHATLSVILLVGECVHEKSDAHASYTQDPRRAAEFLHAAENLMLSYGIGSGPSGIQVAVIENGSIAFMKLPLEDSGFLGFPPRGQWVWERLGDLTDTVFAAELAYRGSTLVTPIEDFPGEFSVELAARWSVLSEADVPRGPASPYGAVWRAPGSRGRPSSGDRNAENEGRFVTKCEGLEMLAMAAHDGWFRDLVVMALMTPEKDSFTAQFLTGSVRELEEERRPHRDIFPGGVAHEQLLTWMRAWRFASGVSAPEWLRVGLAEMAAVAAYGLWWSGQLGSAWAWAYEIDEAEGEIVMAQLVKDVVRHRLAPRWMERGFELT